MRYCLKELSLPRTSVLLTAQSQRSGLCLYRVLEEEETLSSLPFLQRYLLLITVLLLLSVPLLILSLRRLILLPLVRLSEAMHRLESGELDTRIEDGREASELRSLNHSFNHMAQEIQRLKVAVYEEQLEKERTRLQNLSYQLRPHFMVNSLRGSRWLPLFWYLQRKSSGAPLRRACRFALNYI